MAAIRKPARCEVCGGALKNYVTQAKVKDGHVICNDVPVCLKCRTVYKRPVCYGKATLELATDSDTITTIRKIIAPKATVLEGDKIEKEETRP